MSDDDMNVDVEETVEPQKKTRAPRKPKEPEKKGPIYLICTEKVTGHLYDVERNLHIPSAGMNPVQADANIRPGSWLDVQIKAGLIEVR